MRRLWWIACVLCVSTPALAADFTYNPPGDLVTGSGTGRVDDKVYVPGMQFPIEVAPAYPNSQVWGRGGSQGGGGGQCDTQNYSYPWSDNYCETRSWDVPLCPGGKGHQGQDIRPSTCDKDVHWAVAAEAGEITQIGTYSVYLVTPSGTRHRYLHMEPSSLTVRVGDSVTRGQRLGRVSNAFGGTPTTIHLHYDIYQTVEVVGPGYVPTYMSLVRSYEELIGQMAEPCGEIGADGGTIDNEDRCFRLLGKTQFWRSVDDAGFGGALRWTYAFVASMPGAYARWSLEMAQAGEYKVEIYTVPMYAQSKEVVYRIRHNGQEEAIRVDQSAGDGWLEIGTWAFAQGGGQDITLEDNTGESRDLERRIIADALRLTRVDAPEPDMTPDMAAPGDMGAPDMPPTPEPDMGTPRPMPDMSAPEPDMSTQPPAPGADPDGPNVVSTGACACRVGAGAPGGMGGALGWGALLLMGVLGRRRKE